MTETRTIGCSSTVHLPVGILRDGTFYREVEIDKWKAGDKASLSGPAAAKHGITGAINTILRRTIQCIPGVFPQKSNPDHLLPESLVREMATADRLTIFLSVLAYTKDDPILSKHTCTGCRQAFEHEQKMSAIEVVPTPASMDRGGNPPALEVELPEGISTVYKGDPVLVRKGKLGLSTGEVEMNLLKFGQEGEIAQAQRTVGQTLHEMEHIGSVSFFEIQQLSYADWEYLEGLLQEEMPGPDIIIPTDCPHCGEEQFVKFDMSGFFGQSGGATRKRSKRR